MNLCFTQLERSFLQITGPDRFSFLQGLITQDMSFLSPTQSVYSLLLTPQGRFLYDFFLIPVDSSNSSLFIDIDSSCAPSFLNRLNLYKLHSDVKIELREDISLCVFWETPEPLGHTTFLKEMISYQDPRLQELGGRLLSFASPNVGRSFLLENGFQETSFEAYATHLLKWGVPTSPLDLIPEKSIPLECGMQDLHALNWGKGCYLGQELTARTRYQGLVRKQLIPGVLSEEKVPLNARLTFEGQEGGVTRSSQNGYGLALLKLDILQNVLSLQKSFQIIRPNSLDTNNSQEEIMGTFTPFIPSWLQYPFKNP